MWKTCLILSACLLVVAGCSGPKPGTGGNTGGAALADAALLEPFHLKDKPASVQDVIQVRDGARDGDEVVFQGIVPPENVKPYSETRAVFKLMAQADLDDPKIKEEFECDEAAT